MIASGGGHPSSCCRAATGAVMLALLCAGLPAQSGKQRRPEGAVRAFFTAAATGDVKQMEAAAGEVTACGEPALALVVAGLEKRPAGQVVAGLRLLRLADAGAFLDRVAALADHADAGVRAETMVFAAVVGESKGTPLLLRGTEDPDSTVRRRAFDGLLRVGASEGEALQAAVKGLFDEDAWVVGQASRLLGTWPRDASADDRVSQALGELVPRLSGANVRQVFAVLGQRMGQRSLPFVCGGLRQRDDAVVLAAIGAASRLGLRGALPDIRQLCTGQGPVALEATKAVGLLKDREAVPMLVGRLRNVSDRRQREEVAVSLRRITGKTYGYDLQKWEAYVAVNYDA